MKKMRKYISLLIVILTMITLLAFPSSAATNFDKSSTSFSKKWEITTDYYLIDKTSGIQLAEIGSMIWGYNTFAFNEDYCYTRGWNHNRSTAQLKRVGYDTTFQSADTAETTYFSRIEKIHKNDNVIFRMVLSKTYAQDEISAVNRA